MNEAPDNLKYTEAHEWLRLEDDGTVTLGITDHAQQALGELVFVDVPDAGDSFEVGDACAVVESVKAASDVYCPLAGTVTEANPALSDQPELINTGPYVEGWILRLEPQRPADLEDLLDAEAYQQYLARSEG